jgi:hypothetical protein
MLLTTDDQLMPPRSASFRRFFDQIGSASIGLNKPKNGWDTKIKAESAGFLNRRPVKNRVKSRAG